VPTFEEVQAENAAAIARAAEANKMPVDRYLAAALGWDKPGDEGANAMIESLKSEAGAALKNIPQRGGNESLLDFAGRLARAGSAILPAGIIHRLAAKKIKAITDRLPAFNWELQVESEPKPPPEPKP
jgi:hypothetical protein